MARQHNIKVPNYIANMFGAVDEEYDEKEPKVGNDSDNKEEEMNEDEKLFSKF